MRALVWEAARTMNMREQDEPTPASSEVVIKVAYVGICGSELSGYLGHNALRVPPLVMGHEFSGEITALGDGVNGLSIGQRVTVNPLGYCGECVYCQQGLNQLCVKRKLIGAHRPGAYAEFVAAPAELVLPLPDSMSLPTGALTEPVACAVRIGELAGGGSVQGETCLVVGAGPIGLLSLQILKLNGAKQVFLSERDPARLAMAAELGAEIIDPNQADPVKTMREVTGGLGGAVAIDAVGTALTRQQCVSATRSNGTVILSGLHEENSAMPAAEIIRREITVRGSFAYTPANFAQALRLLAANAITLEQWMIEAPLADGGKWFDRLIDAPGDVAKVLLIP